VDYVGLGEGGGGHVGVFSYGIYCVIIHIKRVMLYCLVWEQVKETLLTPNVYV
jgi:hypothetical protein